MPTDDYDEGVLPLCTLCKVFGVNNHDGEHVIGQRPDARRSLDRIASLVDAALTSLDDEHEGNFRECILALAGEAGNLRTLVTTW